MCSMKTNDYSEYTLFVGTLETISCHIVRVFDFDMIEVVIYNE